MVNIKNKDTRGFTLVELLAVIVVLAIVMLLGLQAIMPRIDEARRQVFAMEANGAIEAATTYFMNGSLLGTSEGKLPTNEGATSCVTVADLIDKGYSDLDRSTYTGRVVVKKIGNVYVYSVSLSNGTLMVTDKGFSGNYNSDVTSGQVFDTSEFTNYEKCDGKDSAYPAAATP